MHAANTAPPSHPENQRRSLRKSLHLSPTPSACLLKSSINFLQSFDLSYFLQIHKQNIHMDFSIVSRTNLVSPSNNLSLYKSKSKKQKNFPTFPTDHKNNKQQFTHSKVTLSINFLNYYDYCSLALSLYIYLYLCISLSISIALLYSLSYSLSLCTTTKYFCSLPTFLFMALWRAPISMLQFVPSTSTKCPKVQKQQQFLTFTSAPHPNGANGQLVGPTTTTTSTTVTKNYNKNKANFKFVG